MIQCLLVLHLNKHVQGALNPFNFTIELLLNLIDLVILGVDPLDNGLTQILITFKIVNIIIFIFQNGFSNITAFIIWFLAGHGRDALGADRVIFLRVLKDWLFSLAFHNFEAFNFKVIF